MRIWTNTLPFMAGHGRSPNKHIEAGWWFELVLRDDTGEVLSEGKFEVAGPVRFMRALHRAREHGKDLARGIRRTASVEVRVLP
jgi:hypothetical protein